MRVTPQLLTAIFQCPAARAARWAPHLDQAARLYQIDSDKRLAAWLAQIGHESAGLRYVAEIWGPTKQQLRYEPVTTLSQRLGNTQKGDGRRFAGGGPIQYTGRFNYRTLTADLRKQYPTAVIPDFEARPELIRLPIWGALSAANYWRKNGLNKLADQGDFIGITRRINGGHNGLADRQRLHARAIAALKNHSYQEAT